MYKHLGLCAELEGPLHFFPFHSSFLLLLAADECFPDFWMYVGARSCLPDMHGPAGHLCWISVWLGRLWPVGVCLSLLKAWGKGIVGALAFVEENVL